MIDGIIPLRNYDDPYQGQQPQQPREVPVMVVQGPPQGQPQGPPPQQAPQPQRRMRDSSRNFECPICHKKFRNQSGLDWHLQNKTCQRGK